MATMEAFRAMGVADALRALGLPSAALNLSPDARLPALPVPLDHAENSGDGEFPHWLAVPRVEVQRRFKRRVRSLGGRIECDQGLLGVGQDRNGVHA